MPTFQNDPVVSLSNSTGGAAVSGEGLAFEGVRGVSHNAHGAVVGVNDFSPASPPGAGGNGGWFQSTQGEGVRGWAMTMHHGGVVGVNTAGGFGVYGTSDNGNGVVGESKQAAGIFGRGTPAGRFEGDVEVTGDIRLTNADCAEDFDLGSAQDAEPGTVMVLDDDGALEPSRRAYDTRVAGVVSGAGNLKPGIILDRRIGPSARVPVALMGKAWCLADAAGGPIGVGDLLTTSDRPGHAMAARDPASAFGAVIGKALTPLASGCGAVLVLVGLA